VESNLLFRLSNPKGRESEGDSPPPSASPRCAPYLIQTWIMLFPAPAVTTPLERFFLFFSPRNPSSPPENFLPRWEWTVDGLLSCAPFPPFCVVHTLLATLPPSRTVRRLLRERTRVVSPPSPVPTTTTDVHSKPFLSPPRLRLPALWKKTFITSRTPPKMLFEEEGPVSPRHLGPPTKRLAEGKRGPPFLC